MDDGAPKSEALLPAAGELTGPLTRPALEAGRSWINSPPHKRCCTDRPHNTPYPLSPWESAGVRACPVLSERTLCYPQPSL